LSNSYAQDNPARPAPITIMRLSSEDPESRVENANGDNAVVEVIDPTFLRNDRRVILFLFDMDSILMHHIVFGNLNHQ